MFKNSHFLETKTIYRVTLGAAVSLVVLAGAAIAVFSLMAWPPSFREATAVKQQQAGLEQLAADYARNYTGLIGDYLATVSAENNFYGGDFSKATGDARDRLLALSVPARYKDVHLSSVIILSGILENIRDRETDQIRFRLEKIKELLANF